MTMLERGAQALAKRDDVFLVGDARDIVRAVLSAMREPSDAILDAHHVVPDDTNFRDRARDNWQTMIDAVLAETPA